MWILDESDGVDTTSCPKVLIRPEHAYALKTNAILFYYLNKAFCRMHEYEVMYPLWLCKINNCNMTVNSVSVVYCWTTEQLLSLGC